MPVPPDYVTYCSTLQFSYCWRNMAGPTGILSIREEQFFLVLAIAIGILAGFVVVCFRIAIGWARILLLGSSAHPSWPRVVLVPALTGLVIAFLALRYFPKSRGSGINQTKAALYIYDGYIPPSTVAGKFMLSAIGHWQRSVARPGGSRRCRSAPGWPRSRPLAQAQSGSVCA